ncbi:MAG: phosphatase PAP2 family protein [Chloroflexi bacterium]|nr:phosphatase PAP2 family protein [Chloroflexota bacterium]
MSQGIIARRVRWLIIWSFLFIGLAVAVHARLLADGDAATMKLVAGLRPLALEPVLNWVFRLGFAQVNAVIALVLAALMWFRYRSVLAALSPLVVFAAVGTQAVIQLAVDQPVPGSAYALHREIAAQSISAVLDRADAVVRETFVAAATTPATPSASPKSRGAFPSGHAARSLLLALLLAGEIHRLRSRRDLLSYWLPLGILFAMAVLVSYSALFYGYHWPSDILGGFLLAASLYQVAAWLHDHD